MKTLRTLRALWELFLLLRHKPSPSPIQPARDLPELVVLVREVRRNQDEQERAHDADVARLRAEMLAHVEGLRTAIAAEVEANGVRWRAAMSADVDITERIERLSEGFAEATRRIMDQDQDDSEGWKRGGG